MESQFWFVQLVALLTRWVPCVPPDMHTLLLLLHHVKRWRSYAYVNSDTTIFCGTSHEESRMEISSGGDDSCLGVHFYQHLVVTKKKKLKAALTWVTATDCHIKRISKLKKTNCCYGWSTPIGPCPINNFRTILMYHPCGTKWLNLEYPCLAQWCADWLNSTWTDFYSPPGRQEGPCVACRLVRSLLRWSSSVNVPCDD